MALSKNQPRFVTGLSSSLLDLTFFSLTTNNPFLAKERILLVSISTHSSNPENISSAFTSSPVRQYLPQLLRHQSRILQFSVIEKIFLIDRRYHQSRVVQLYFITEPQYPSIKLTQGHGSNEHLILRLGS
jgi:hypothetical protein